MKAEGESVHGRSALKHSGENYLSEQTLLHLVAEKKNTEIKTTKKEEKNAVLSNNNMQLNIKAG